MDFTLTTFRPASVLVHKISDFSDDSGSMTEYLPSAHYEPEESTSICTNGAVMAFYIT
jgi:hypothetical protein